jgi:alpha-tubulin suppressor-like RCC1 family protein
MKPVHRLKPDRWARIVSFAGLLGPWACTPTSGPTDDADHSGQGSEKPTDTGGRSGGAASGETGTNETGGSRGTNIAAQGNGGAPASGGVSANGGDSESLGGSAGAASTPTNGAEIVQLVSGGAHRCVLNAAGAVKCWGSNELGILGLGDTDHRGDDAGEMGAALPEVRLGTNRRAVSLAAGYLHTCAIFDDGSVKCWGTNEFAQLGLGDLGYRGDEPGEMGDALATVDLGAGHKAKALAAGGYHTCAILEDDSVKCWGTLLGFGDAEARGDEPGEMGDNLKVIDLGTDRTARSISVGFYHSCAILDDNSLKCWGMNDYGQLGLGDLSDRGDEPGEMGDDLPRVDLGTSRTALSVSAGAYRTCVILDDRSIKCWGMNTLFSLGFGALGIWGDEPSEVGNNLQAVPLGTERKAQALYMGIYHSCALLDNSDVKCWGSNQNGELGLGDTNPRGEVPSKMGDSLPALSLGSGNQAAFVAAGGYSSCVLLSHGAVKCWGASKYGQHGQGDLEDRGDNPGEMGDALPYVPLW